MLFQLSTSKRRTSKFFFDTITTTSGIENFATYQQLFERKNKKGIKGRNAINAGCKEATGDKTSELSVVLGDGNTFVGFITRDENCRTSLTLVLQ